MIKLVCPECRHENEPERIYCHSCGARLDRSALANAKSTEEDPQATQRRLKAMLDPQQAKLRLLLLRLGKLILGAVLVALIIQMILPPDVPPPVKAAILPTQIGLELENAASSHRAAPLRYTEDQANAYLGNSLRSKRAALSKGLQFERALVAFDEGTVRVTTERSLIGYSLYLVTLYRVTLKDGKLDAVDLGGQIGRLPIHPQIMKYAEGLNSNLWAALDRERKSLAKMAGFELHPKLVVLTPRA